VQLPDNMPQGITLAWKSLPQFQPL